MTATKKAASKATATKKAASKATHLRPGFSALVTTTDTMTVNTALGPVVQPAEVYVKAGGELPENLADGQYDRLAKHGAFDVVEVPRHTVDAQEALHALPGDAEKTTADVRLPSEEEVAAKAAFEQAQEDVRKAFAEAEAEAGEDDGVPPSGE